MPLELAIVDGFDHYANSTSTAELNFRQYWDFDVGTNNFPNPLLFGGLNGSRGSALNLSAFVASNGRTDAKVYRTVSVGTKISLHLCVKFNNISLARDSLLVLFMDAFGAIQCSLAVRPTGRLALFSGKLGTLLAESSANFRIGPVYRFSLAFDAELGTAQLAIKGSLADGFDVSGVDLLATAQPDIQMFGLGIGNTNGVSDSQSWVADDLIYGVGEAVLIPELEIITQTPNSDFLQQWTPLVGTDNFAMVADIPADLDAGYNSSSVVGNRDLFGFPLLPAAPDSVFGISFVSGIKKEESGTRAIKHAIEQAGVLSYGPNLNQNTSYDHQFSHFLTNPLTGNAWTQAELEAAHFGYEDAI